VSGWREAVALARPRLLPFVLALVGLGYGFAHWDHALPARAAPELAAVLVGWTLLHAASLWFNALLDRGDGEVLLGAPARPPAWLGVAAWLALGVHVAVVARWAPAAAPAAVICAALAVLYSHPVAAWKGHPWLGPAVNVVGYGALTPYAGWAIVGAPAGARAAAVLGTTALGVLGSYFLAQMFQEDEDRARGYRTLVATAGSAAAAAAARWSLVACLVGLAALMAAGWLPRLPLLAAPLAWPLWRSLRDAEVLPRAGGHAQAVAVARALMRLTAATLLLAWVSYCADSLSGGPVAGLATRAGRDGPVAPVARSR
jgi:1,4-dihydroxy-2-naphthoate octaprenyltransferase